MMRGICIELFRNGFMPLKGYSVMTAPEIRLAAGMSTREL